MNHHFTKLRLSDLGDIARGVTYKSPDDLRLEGSPRTIRLLRATNIQDGAITLDDVQVIDESCAHDRQRLATGDIAICIANGSRALVGKSALVDMQDADGYVVGAFCARFRPKIGESADLIAALFESGAYRGWIDRLLGTTTINNLKPSDIADCPIVLPTIQSVRRRLGEILRTSRAMLRRTDALIAAKHEQKRGLMQQLLTGKVRFPGFTEPWRMVAIEDLMEEHARKVAWDDEKVYRLISIRRRNGGVFPREELPGSKILTKSLFSVESGDLLVSCRQVVHGAIAVVPPELSGSCVSGEYLCLRERKAAQVDARFLNLIAHLPAMRKLTLNCSYGVHVEKLNLDVPKFMRSKVLVAPTLAEQMRIVGFFGSIEQQLSLLQAQRAALASQRRGLIERLLSGDIALPSSDTSAA